MYLEKLDNVSKEDLIKQILNKTQILSQEELLELNGFLTCELYKLSNNNEQINSVFKNDEKNDIKIIISLLNELISILSNEKDKNKKKHKKRKYSISSKNSFDLYSSDSDNKYSKIQKKNKSYFDIMAKLNYDKKKSNKKKKEGQKKNIDDYIENIENENSKNKNPDEFLLEIQNNKIVSHKI